ncbi:MAG: hypothetical protein MUE61_19355 [Vicinamibacterales bacterium]|nr:hypothetical protein [Vicinamibacterales bacterium]
MAYSNAADISYSGAPTRVAFSAQFPDERRGVLHGCLREAFAQVPHELQLAREAAVPEVERHGVLQRGELLGRRLAREFFRLEGGVDDGARAREPGQRRGELIDGRHALDAGDGRGVADQVQADAFVAGAAVGDREKERARLRSTVDDEGGVRDLDAREVHHVVVLEELAAGGGRGAEQDDHPVGDLLDELRPPGGVLGRVEQQRACRGSRQRCAEGEDQQEGSRGGRSELHQDLLEWRGRVRAPL